MFDKWISTIGILIAFKASNIAIDVLKEIENKVSHWNLPYCENFDITGRL